MSSSSFLLATFLLLPAGAGLLVLAVNKDPEENERSQEEGGFRSRVFDVSPTHSADEQQGADAVPGERAAEPATGQWLADSLAQLEESYQAMRQQGEELAQALHASDNEVQSDSSKEPATSSRISAATPLARADAQSTDVVPAIEGQPAEPGAPAEGNALAPQDNTVLAEAARMDQATGLDQAAVTEQVGALDQTVLASAANQDPTRAAASGEAPLSPEDAARAEQLRIAVALEKHQAFIISLLPLFLPIPAAADASVPQAAVPAGPIPVVDMSGIAWGPVDMAGTTSP